ncbi:hypothetical protein [Paenibacillus xylanexedens]|uniref:SIR2-like domain-containing protein n=1 Tax=Paenibacillus xylanexedens TaxID=528191 RepID=A0ABS4RQN9_PAEXY|nr:hypothetical protein [Paenibacillus xylanexedens]MBP2245187.1 hypothetical protein [Paenibacillus xylanexedens]
MKNYFIVLGNGFTIDFINTIKKTEEINVMNLFSMGDSVPWPADNEPGFLSYKRCPNLWYLGARPNMDNTSAMSLLEDLITCANTASGAGNRHLDTKYIQAYQELQTYLKYLFIYYDNQITQEEISENVDNWGWFKFFKKLNESNDCNNVTIVTYNYDIWLERILISGNINFNIQGINNGVYDPDNPYKFNIIKPHGSISFSYQQPIDPNRFVITSTQRELTNGDLSNYSVNYNNLENIYMLNAMIPPAGDSSRLESTWAYDLRKIALEEASKLTYADELLICGISYWHVDRGEMDQLLININPEINVKSVNPRPTSTLNAVLTSLFKSHIGYQNSKILGDIKI